MIPATGENNKPLYIIKNCVLVQPENNKKLFYYKFSNPNQGGDRHKFPQIQTFFRMFFCAILDEKTRKLLQNEIHNFYIFY